MKRTNNQLYHFILSFPEVALREWYNTCIIDPYGDHAYQTIRENTYEQEAQIKDTLTLETLIQAATNPATNFAHDQLWMAVTGGETPYIISFNHFEEFLSKMAEQEQFLQFVQDNPELLEELEEIAER